MDFDTDINRSGGLAATHELLRIGYTQRQLGYATATGRIIRVRQGWYCLPGTEPKLQEAVRVGGRIGCISAAEHHGLWVRHTERLHVEVRQYVARLRSRTDKRVRLTNVEDPLTVVHWCDAGVAGTRFATGIRASLRCMAMCRPPEEVVAAVDSALRTGKLTERQWANDIHDLPRRLRRLLGRIDRRSESIIESLTRFRLQYLGIEPRVQVSIVGVGRVDFVIGRRLVIEVDGWEFHSDREKFESDRRRDAKLSARNFRVLRFSYHQIMNCWSEVRAAIQASIARGDHLD